MIVLDASVTLAWLFADEHSAAADAVMDQVAIEGAVVPSLWRIETANSLNASIRRGRSDPTVVAKAIDELSNLSIVEDNETGARAWSDTMVLARNEGLTVYDATYLELALRRALPLASGDKALVAAANRRGLEVLAV